MDGSLTIVGRIECAGEERACRNEGQMDEEETVKMVYRKMELTYLLIMA